MAFAWVKHISESICRGRRFSLPYISAYAKTLKTLGIYGGKETKKHSVE
jgi:hypothetical protein